MSNGGFDVDAFVNKAIKMAGSLASSKEVSDAIRGNIGYFEDGGRQLINIMAHYASAGDAPSSVVDAIMNSSIDVDADGHVITIKIDEAIRESLYPEKYGSINIVDVYNYGIRTSDYVYGDNGIRSTRDRSGLDFIQDAADYASRNYGINIVINKDNGR